MTPEDLASLKAIAEAAHAEIHGICDGSRKWRMRVPANEEDSDLLFSRAIDGLEKALAELSEKDARIAVLESALRRILLDVDDDGCVEKDDVCIESARAALTKSVGAG